MLNIIKQDEKQYVSAKELYNALELNPAHYSRWVDMNIVGSNSSYKDYSPFMVNERKGRGKFSQDYLLSVNFAKFLCTTSGSQKALPYVEWLISLDNKVNEGELLNSAQIVSLVTLIPFFALSDFREDVKKQHFEVHNNKYDWHKYRADVLGYDVNELKNALAQIGEKYKSIDVSFMKLDKHLLIKNATMDFLLAMGKSTLYAENVSTIAYKASKSMDLRFDKLDSTLFHIPLAVRERYLIAKNQSAI